jgi:hypothetical protein
MDDELDFLNKKPESILVEPPVGVSRQDFANVVIAAGAFWTAQGVAPTAQGLVQLGLTSLKLKAVTDIMSTVEFSVAMQSKGVPWDEMDQLTPAQLAALEVMTNPLRGGTHSQRLKAAGCTELEWRMWKKNAVFAAHFKALVKDRFTDNTELIDLAIVQGALSGKLENAKYLDELTGRHDPNKQQAINVQALLIRIVEIVQLSGASAEAIANIAQGMQNLVDGMDIAGAKREPSGLIAQYKKEITNVNVY